MLTEGYNFGGEQSGHFIFLDHNTTGDGLISALQIVSLMKRTKRPLSDLAIADKSPGELPPPQPDNATDASAPTNLLGARFAKNFI